MLLSNNRWNKARHWSPCFTMGNPTILQKLFIKLTNHFEFFTSTPESLPHQLPCVTSNSLCSKGSHLDSGEHSKKPLSASPWEGPQMLGSLCFHCSKESSETPFDNSTPSKLLNGTHPSKELHHWSHFTLEISMRYRSSQNKSPYHCPWPIEEQIDSDQQRDSNDEQNLRAPAPPAPPLP